MEIDIISYTDDQFAALSEEQILQVREAQLKKNELERALEEDLQKEKDRLVENGMISSGIWPLLEAKLREECEEEVEWIRDSLLFYLRFTPSTEVESVPYLVDYSLSYEEREAIVRSYYMNEITDPAERFELYKADEFARTYIGEYYKPLYDYILEFVE